MKSMVTVPRLTAIAVLCAVASAGCDSRELLGPATRTVSPLSSVDAPVSLGSGFVPAPPNTSPAAVATPPYAHLAAFPESTWVVVNVAGNVQLAWNDEPCRQRAIDAPFWPCQDGSPLSAFGTEPWDGGPLSLQATFGNGGNGAVKLRGSGGSAEGGGSAVGLFYASQSGSLSGHVNMTAQWAWDPTFGNGPYSYNVSGGYTVTATAVPSPFQVTEGAPDASGAVTYTVEPLYDLRFSTPVNGWPAGATFWAFYPGDSLPDRPDRSWPGWQITECQFQLVCRWKPPVAGRMQVLAHLEDQPAYARSKSAQEPSLTLTCNLHADSVTIERGGDIDCRAQAKPQGGRPITWEFVADSFPYRNPEAGSTVHTGESWAGKMVLSGTITARDTIQSRALEATIRVRVTARDWRGKEFEASAEDSTPPAGEFRARPDSMRELGHIHNATRYIVAPGYWSPILSGPNNLLGYFVKVPIVYHGRVHVNRLALRDSSEFWFAQRERMPTLQPGDVIPCLRSDVVPFIPIVLRHEGVGFDPKSHAYLFVEEGKKVFGPAAEPIVGGSAQELFDRLQAAMDPMIDKAKSASALADSTGYAPVYCTFNYHY